MGRRPARSRSRTEARGQHRGHHAEVKSTPPDGRYAAVVLVDNIVRGQSAGFTLTGCGGTLPFTGASTIPTLAVGLVMVVVGLALVRRTRTAGRSA
jgi:hypothetical protein